MVANTLEQQTSEKAEETKVEILENADILRLGIDQNTYFTMPQYLHVWILIILSKKSDEYVRDLHFRILYVGCSSLDVKYLGITVEIIVVYMKALIQPLKV